MGRGTYERDTDIDTSQSALKMNFPSLPAGGGRRCEGVAASMLAQRQHFWRQNYLWAYCA